MQVFRCWGPLAIALTAASLVGMAACDRSQTSRRPSKSPGSERESQTIAETEGKALTRHFEGLTLASAYGCAVEDDGALWCWGDDPAIRLGLRPGEADPHKATRVSGLGPVKAVVSARSSIHETTCALLRSGEVHCWGIGVRGQKTGIHRVEKLANVEQLAARRDVCARTSAGAVHCWTPNGEGQAGEPRHILDGAIDIDSGYMSCALDAAFSVRCWGGGTMAQFKAIARAQGGRWNAPEDGIAVMAEVDGAVEVDVGMHNFCVRRTSGEVLCALLPGTEDIRKPPPLEDLDPIPGTDGARDLSLSDQHGCAVDRLGGVRCWGANEWAQLGDGTSNRRDRHPVAVSGLENIVAVATAETRSCAMSETEVQCWGTSAADEYDRRDRETVLLPFRSREVRAVDYLTCALGEDGKTRCWGPRATTNSFSKHKFFADPGGIMAASTPTELPLQLGGIRAMHNAGGLCLLDADHTLVCADFEHPEWPGEHATLPNQTFMVKSREPGVLDMDGEPGPTLLLLQSTKPRLESRPAPTVHRDNKKIPPFGDIIDFANNSAQSCVAHGSGVVDCWDHFDYANGKSKKVHRIPGLSDAAGVIAFPSTTRTCAWTRQGKVVCWSVTITPSTKTTEVVGIDDIDGVVELVASVDELCARKSDGSLACAPLDRESIGRWQRVDVPPIVQLTAGHHHICMIHGDGETRCMGDNAYGQLGGLSARTVARPTPIVFAD
jgi:alpha-tubulin suppressor-like RCC1 family protein